MTERESYNQACPEGYRELDDGELIQEGDYSWDTLFKRWLPTFCAGMKQSLGGDAEYPVCRIRKIEAPGKAATHDDGKLPVAMLPPAGWRAVAKVQAYGHKKYGDFNNYRKGMEASRQANCIQRHLLAWIDGEDNDPESGENHLAHAATRLLFVLQNIHDGTLIDDRYRKATQPTT